MNQQKIEIIYNVKKCQVYSVNRKIRDLRFEENDLIIWR